MHHLANAISSGASTLWFLVISGSVQPACKLEVPMPLPISVVLCWPTQRESVVANNSLVRTHLWIANGLNPIPWSRVSQNFEHVYHKDSKCVPEKAEAEPGPTRRSKKWGGAPEDTVYVTPKHVAPPRKNGGRTPKGDTSKVSESQSKGKGNKKAKP